MSNILNLTNKEIELLEKNNIKLDYIESEKNVVVCDTDGNKAQGSVLCSIVVRDLVEMFSEEEETKTLSDEEILAKEGYTIICESPFEIESKDGQIATGGFAKAVLAHFKY